MSALVSVLTRYRRGATLFQICQMTDKPGYGYMVTHGATALTETWDGPTFGFSQNHFMNGAIASWFFRGLLGICQDPSSAGYTSILIRPQLVSGISWASGWLDTVSGRIEVSWRASGCEFAIEGHAPVNSSCVVELPSGKRQVVCGPFAFAEPFSVASLDV
jgi:alpha-L-rhamnosidase